MMDFANIDIGRIGFLFSVWALPVLVAITLHEAAHGFVAWRLGDDTAHVLGRVSFNPLRHVDPFGTILLPAMLLLASGGRLMFGYAKPVPVNFGRLRKPRRDMVLVAAAGPASNILLLAASATKARYWSASARIEIWARSTFCSRASASSKSSGPANPSSATTKAPSPLGTSILGSSSKSETCMKSSPLAHAGQGQRGFDKILRGPAHQPPE